MRIYKVIVDKKPKWCIGCPIGKRTEHECGSWRNEEEEDAHGWKSGGIAPDERCLLEERK